MEKFTLKEAMRSAWKKVLLKIACFFLNLTAEKDTLYSATEPTDKQMEGKEFWIKVDLVDKEK